MARPAGKTETSSMSSEDSPETSEAEVEESSASEVETASPSQGSSASEPSTESSGHGEAEPSETSGATSEQSDAEPDVAAKSPPVSQTSEELGQESRKAGGSDSRVASARTKIDHKDQGRLETFEAGAFGTLEEHVASHNFPAHVRTCSACKFWKNRWKWSSACSCVNPVTNKKETWIGAKNGFSVCLLCAAYKGAASRSEYGQGLGSFRRKSNLVRHATTREHKDALHAWEKRLRAQEAAGEAISFFDVASGRATSSAMVASAPLVSAPAESAKDKAASSKTQRPLEAERAVVAARALLESSGSFHSFEVWRDALGGAERLSLESSWHCRQLVTTMAHYEKEIFFNSEVVLSSPPAPHPRRIR